MPGYIDWLDDPASDRGIHFRAEDDWKYESYPEIADYAFRVAGLLRSAEVPAGAVVSLMFLDSASFVHAFLGAMAGGVAPSPIASPLTFDNIDRYVEHASALVRAAGAVAILCDQAMAELAAATIARVPGDVALLRLDLMDSSPETARRAPTELALLQFTSGSSGNPRGVAVTPDNLNSNLAAIRSWLGMGKSDAVASWLPLYHDMGLIGTLMTPISAQIDLWQMTPIDLIRSPRLWLECLGKHGATITAAPNFGYALAARRVKPAQLEGLDFSGWRIAMSGAERVSPDVVTAVSALLQPYGFRPEAFAPCYGLAESTLAVTGTPPGHGVHAVQVGGPFVTGEPMEILDHAVLGTVPLTDGNWLVSCGRPLDGLTVDVIGEDGAVLPDGCFGEIRLVGSSVALGYRGAQADPSDERARFAADGFHTKDSGFVLAGELYVVGRLGDSVKVYGRKVHSEDLDLAVQAVPGVRAGRCAVTLDGRGPVVRAIAVVESAGADWAEPVLIQLKALLGPEAEITVIRAANGSIPRTSSGKPRRRELHARVVAGTFGGEVLLAPAQPVPTA